MIRHLPNILTLLRILVGAAGAVALWLSWRWEASGEVPAGLGDPVAVITGLASFAVFAFVFAALTDWLDGFLARKLKAESTLGAFLDPIGDKVLVNGYLLAYAAILSFPVEIIVPILAILSRDIIVTILRVSGDKPAGETLPVSLSAKLKTVLAMLTAGFPLLAFVMGWQSTDWALLAWIGALWLTASMTLLTGLNYLMEKRAG
ncbi:MAG: CDP-alcohol phosphatidyltransferase family protein [Maricaulis sp.]|uniref:CDP-alcohol phosphatidyltransferase family protein n=1 Tax=Maricaulis sp. TaxID=1486257 RepID=UPI001B2994DF|nr:CDP-alcohol phosphatidyltransferase family protein [Maricaulis sp.]MBO6847455.1 CDP-alcohol phosphatidyltransferase family protein [Maricaulis sp.]MBO6877025.1 CDP-alcohol phosphatidyltransferase family protein [Maricaulis sp.]